jgi:hypothetical protein
LDSSLATQSKEAEWRLSVELTRLKEEIANKEARWELERMNHHETVSILQAQIGESEKANSKISEALNTMTKKA